jgi:hypothetical protein
MSKVNWRWRFSFHDPKILKLLQNLLDARPRNVSWRRLGTIHGRYEWIAMTLWVTFVDLNIWIENWDFGKDGLHLNQCGARKLSQMYSSVLGFSGGRLTVNEWRLLSTKSEGTSEGTRNPFMARSKFLHSPLTPVYLRSTYCHLHNSSNFV